jgi:hypothetical protein
VSEYGTLVIGCGKIAVDLPAEFRDGGVLDFKSFEAIGYSWNGQMHYFKGKEREVMDLKIDEAAVKEVVAKAIMDQLGEAGRERLVTTALEHLLASPKDGFGRPSYSPLQIAFDQAAQTAAAKIIREEVAESPEFIAKVKEKVGEAIAKMDDVNYTDNLAQALAQVMKSR